MKIIASPPVNNRLQLAIEFPYDGLRMRRTPVGVVLSLPDCRAHDEPGAPQLPHAAIRVALPVGTDVGSIEVSEKATTVVSTELLFLAPVQPYQPGTEFSVPPSRRIRPVLNVDRHPETPPYLGVAQSAFVPPKRDLYLRALEKRRPLAHYVVTHRVGPYPVAVVELNPLRLQRDGSLELITQLELTLILRPTRDDEKEGAVFASQLSRSAGIVRRSVVNPDIAIDTGSALGDIFRFPTHLIITNDEMAAAFKKLSQWKTSRGVTSRVITIKEIRAKKYGNFNKGTRDDQEMIRKFLRWALEKWGIQWVLLGGDINIIPIRMAASMGSFEIDDDVDNPRKHHPVGHWTGSFLMVDCNIDWFDPSANNILLRIKDNTIIPYDDGSSNTTTPNWYFTQDANGSTRSLVATRFVRVNGSEDAVRKGLRFLQRWNTIPTDFYYSSLRGYPFEIAHHWDLLNNRIYGLATLKEDGHVETDSIRWTSDVSVGRAPVEDVKQAENFVNKVIAYEKFQRPDGSRLDSAGWPHRMLFVSSNWGGRWSYMPGGQNPPPPDTYHHSGHARWTMLHLDPESGAIGVDRRLLVQVSETDVREIPYVETVEPGGRGWHFAKNSADPTANIWDLEIEIPGGMGKCKQVYLPWPSEWIAVYGADDELTPECYILDTPTLDSSAFDQEELRKQVAQGLPWLTEISRLYEDTEDLPALDIAAAPLASLNRTTLKDALNAPPHIVSLSGHGNTNGTCFLDINLAGSLKNGYQTFIAYADSCLTNAFDTDDSMGETLILNKEGGALAYIGNTRSSWIGLGDDVQRAFFHGLASERHLGALNDTRCDYLSKYPSNWQHRWALMSLNLTGDPETPIWTDNPGVLIVNKAPKLSRKIFHIEVRRRRELFPRPPRWCWPEESAPDVIVHLRIDDFTQWAVTDKDGHATFDLSHAPLGKAIITASAQGYIPQVVHSAVVGPLWVEGRVVSVQVGDGPGAEVQIAIDQPEGSTEIDLIIDSAMPEARLILDAVMRTHLSPQKVWFYLDELADGQKIRRLAVGERPPSEV